MNPIFKFLAAGALATATHAAEIKPGELFDYPAKAFYPERWKEKRLTAPMRPWTGEEIALVTPDKEYDAAAITNFVGHLDAGWRLYRELIGQRPRMNKNHQGAPTIVALPHNGLSCGYGCGYVGATGIEMTNFDKHLAGSISDPLNIPHAYFYEMGRNYFVFGDRHSCFTTGFAVFMRYVCTDTLGLNDSDKRTRKIINEAISRFEKNDMSFLDAMTTHGPHGEKGNRLKDENGNTISPTDQNVMYASLMLKLRSEFGGNEFVEKFYHSLQECPRVRPIDQEAARKQCLTWLVCASSAAKTNLTERFTKTWKLKLDDAIVTKLNDIDWENTSPKDALASLTM